MEFSNDQLRVAALTEMLSGFGEKVAEFAKREWSLKRDQKAAAKQAEQSFCQSSDTLEPQIQEALETVQGRFSEQRDGIDQRQQAEHDALVDRVNRIVAEIERVRQHRIDVAKHHYQEATWVTNNGIQAMQASEDADLEKLKAEVAGRQEALQPLKKRQKRLLKRFKKNLSALSEEPVLPDSTDPTELLDMLHRETDAAAAGLAELERNSLVGFFRSVRAPGWCVLTLLIAGGVGFGLFKVDLLNATSGGTLGGITALTLLLLVVFDSVAGRQVAKLAPPLVGSLQLAEALCNHLLEVARQGSQDRCKAHAEEMDVVVQEAKTESDTRIKRADATAVRRLEVVDRERTRLLDELKARHDAERPGIDEAEAAAVAELQARSAASIDDLSAQYAAKAEEQERQFHSDFNMLVEEWQTAVTAVNEKIVAVDDLSYSLAADWQDESWADWSAVSEAKPRIPFASLTVNTEDLFTDVPTDAKLPLDLPEAFNLPALLMLPDHCNLLIEGREKARDIGIATLQNVMCRLLTQMPPGTVRFTLVDPIGLGQSFAGFMHLADYDDALVGGRIWTDERQIDSCLADLNDHMETVIQKYLRNEYDSIADYNVAAGQIAEPFRFLVIADFPVNFSETAVRRLMSIADSGARCGVYVLMLWDRRHQAPPNFSAGDMRKNGVHLHYLANRLAWKGQGAADFKLTLQPPPPDELLSSLLHRVGEGSSKRARVEVPFRSIAPEAEQMWSKSSAEGLDIAIGQTGTRTQALKLGEGTSQHVLVAGNTGSGKSTLLHVLITNAAMWYSPEELQFYLIDFKKGVEFKSYATLDLPHAQAIAIESDRGFGLSVLERVDEVLRDRGTEMRRYGVQSVAAYRKLDGVEPMPRIIVIIDEFQEFFVEDDKVAQDAALLLDRIVRQGRAFGIHMLLGTQTLGGAYSLARSTLGQMSVRIALQCSEQDSYLILSDDNTAARLLSRPGEAIYNDAAGAVEGNSPFQVVWLSEEDRDECLGDVAAVQAERQAADGGPAFVFEGNMPADVTRNLELKAMINGEAESRSACTLWFGTPNAIKGPTRTVLRRQGGDNLLIVGQQEKTALALYVVALRALAAQKRPEDARFVILDGSPSDAVDHGRLAASMASCQHTVHDVAYNKVPEVIGELAAEQRQRQDADGTPAQSVFVVVYGLQRYRKLRNEDDYSFSDDDTPDQQFAELLRDGPDVGIHFLIWCDTVNNLNRTLSRKTLREFDHKVLFQMSGNDSMTLIDSTIAGDLGMHRAVFHNEQEGIEETFNPYALPDPDWPGGGAASVGGAP